VCVLAGLLVPEGRPAVDAVMMEPQLAASPESG